MQANPLWPTRKRFPKLEGKAKADVVIVGGGMAGICYSFFLQKAGFKTIVLEQDEVGNAASGASSGILYYGSGTNFVDAVKLFGREKATLLWNETREAIQEIEKIVKENSFERECGFRKPGASRVAKTKEEAEYLLQEHE